MKNAQNLRGEFEECGRVWLRGLITDTDLSFFDDLASGEAKAGQRLSSSLTLKNALGPESSLMRAIKHLDADAKPVRAVAFNKTPRANWGVPWHQDRVIQVVERADVAAYKNWTNKTGAWHCEPPQSILDNMLFVRIHLDDSDHSNGAMQIAVGSHANGIIPASTAEAEAANYPVEICEARRGDILILKMLTLHCSSPAIVPVSRRTLRIDFASIALPEPLKWPTLSGKNGNAV